MARPVEVLRSAPMSTGDTVYFATSGGHAGAPSYGTATVKRTRSSRSPSGFVFTCFTCFTADACEHARAAAAFYDAHGPVDFDAMTGAPTPPAQPHTTGAAA